MREEWRDVVGYEGLYKCSNYGNVKGRKLSRNLKPSKLQSSKNYYRLQVGLYKNKKCHTMFLHKVIATAFLENPNNYPQINHIDHDTSNNHINNLEWCTSKQNHMHNELTYKQSDTFKFSEEDRCNIVDLYNYGYSSLMIAELYDASANHVRNLLHKKNVKLRSQSEALKLYTRERL